jgi:2,3-dihydroxybiphenyl 1,2-dioxygenase
VIESLSYIGFRSPRAEEWATFGPEILGLELVDRGPDGAVRLRHDDAAFRIAIHPGEADDLAYLGWAVAGPEALADAVSRLETQGLVVHRGSPALAAERAVTEVVWLSDPFGFRHELSWGQLTRPSTFRPGRAVSGFVTGEGGLGHCVLIVPDLAEAERFYMGVLGFTLSDCVEVGMSIRFLHCNSRHHSLAFAVVPGMVGVHHMMLELSALDDVGSAYDLVQGRDDIPVAMTLGRHANDLMTSFYLRTPSGFEIEYGWGGALVDESETWVAGSYDAISVWGHKTPDEPLLPGILRPFPPVA